MINSHKISVRLSDDQYSRLNRLSSKFNISKSKVIQLLLSIHHSHLGNKNLNELTKSNNHVIDRLNALYGSNWKIGINLNQIAHQMNKNGISFKDRSLLSGLISSISSVDSLIKKEMNLFDNQDYWTKPFSRS